MTDMNNYLPLSGGPSGSDPVCPSGGGPLGPNDPGGMGDAPVRQLNSLLRGEISAAETYRLAIDKLAHSDDANVHMGLLSEIQEEHGRAAQALRDRIRELGGEASDSSGPWGVWAKITQRTSNLLGDSAALKNLKEGEEHGLKEYEEAMDDVDVSSAELVQNQFIPAQQRHISLLDQLINAAGRA